LLLQTGVNSATNDGSTPLMFAAQEGHDAVVAALLRAGSIVDMAKGDRTTALALAVDHGWTVVVELLLPAGAQDDISSGEHGATPLADAASARRRATRQW